MSQPKIPETTIDLLSRNFFKEAIQYGFKYEDYLRFVNTLLDYAIQTKNGQPKEEKKNINGFFETIENWKLPLETKNLKIREFQIESDTKYLKDWIKDKYGRHFLLSISSSKSHTVENLISLEKKFLGIITLKDDKPIGAVAFLNHDVDNSKAELRKMIGNTKYRGMGFGKEATKYWIKYGFEELNLKKIYLNTIDTNFRNIKINEELGFKIEGILRDEVIYDNIPHDVLRMGLVKS